MSNKFFAKKFTDENGVKWDSKREYSRYLELNGMEQNDIIKNLDRQISFELLPKHKCLLDEKTERAVNYTCDFIYIFNDTLYIEDVKSKYTRTDRDYILRRKMLKYFYLNKKDVEFKKLHEALPNIEFKNAQFMEVL